MRDPRSSPTVAELAVFDAIGPRPPRRAALHLEARSSRGRSHVEHAPAIRSSGMGTRGPARATLHADQPRQHRASFNSRL